jgi:sugar/nucleoside kinase (ribokinase family)
MGGKRVLVVGEVNPDLIMSGYRAPPVPGREVLVEDATLVLGSASAICAVGLARLGTEVAFLGKVGADLWGDFCLEGLRREGVDVSRVMRVPGLKTGITVSLTSPRDRALVTHLGAIASLRAEDVTEASLAGFGHLHVSSYFLQARLRPGLLGLFATARRLGLSTSLDPGHDPAELWGADLLDTAGEADLFFPSELALLAATGSETPEAALRRLDRGGTRTVAKLGIEGCMTLEAGSLLRVPAFEVEAVDTTGANDSFDAGFLHRWLEGRPLAECLRWAAAVGALSTRAAGGTAGQPTAAEVAAFLA